MRKILCYLLANWLALFPNFATAGTAAESAMVEYEPQLSAPSVAKTVAKVHQGHHTFSRDGIGRLNDIQSDDGSFHLQLIYHNALAVYPNRAIYNGHDIELPLSPKLSKYYGGMEYSDYMIFMEDWIDQQPGQVPCGPGCYDDNGGNGDGAFYAFVGTLMGAGLGTLFGAVLAFAEGAELAAIYYAAGLMGLTVGAMIAVFAAGYFIGGYA